MKLFCEIIVLLSTILPQVMCLVPLKFSNKYISSISYSRIKTLEDDPTIKFYIVPSSANLRLGIKCGGLEFHREQINDQNCWIFQRSDRKFRNDQLRCLVDGTNFNISKNDVYILEAPVFLRIQSFDCSSVSIQYQLLDVIKCLTDPIPYEFQFKEQDDKVWQNKTGTFDKNSTKQTITLKPFDELCESRIFITRLRYRIGDLWSNYRILNLNLQIQFNDDILEKLLIIEGKSGFFHRICGFKKCREEFQRKVKSQIFCGGHFNDFSCHYNKSSQKLQLNCESFQENDTSIFRGNFQSIKNVDCVYTTKEHDSIRYNNEFKTNLYSLISKIELVLINSCDYGVLKWHTHSNINSFLGGYEENVSVQFRWKNDSWRNLRVQNVKSSSDYLKITFEFDEDFRDNEERNVLKLNFNNLTEYAIFDIAKNCQRIRFLPNVFVLSLILFWILGIMLTYACKLKIKHKNLNIELPKDLQEPTNLKEHENVYEMIPYDYPNSAYKDKSEISNRHLPQPPEELICSDNYITMQNINNAYTTNQPTKNNMNPLIDCSYIHIK